MSTLFRRPKYKRIMLKFSGEALVDASGEGIDFSVLHYIAKEIKSVLAKKVAVGVIIGGGNLFRGADLKNVNRITGDQMGMLATLINSLAMRDVFLKEKIPAVVLSALPVAGIVDQYDRSLALRYLDEGQVLILAGGTGNPLVTTDTALSLRGIELQADLLLKATNVDGVYSANPVTDPSAKFFRCLTYEEALNQKLQVMDLMSFYLCREHDMTLRVYNMHKPGALLRIVVGLNEGTLLKK